jgi:hypothetical protein
LKNKQGKKSKPVFMRVVYFIFFLFAGLSAFSQEIVTGLQFNPVVAERSGNIQMQKSMTAGEDTIPISLPFYDDFSGGEIFPASQRWIDRYAYVNTDFPVYPIDFGAVTLDAINDSGHVYSNGVPGPQTFEADHLTSRYIRLDSLFTPAQRAYTRSDSIYLSFYYQPQGRGLAPSTSDSLLLQFLFREAFDTIIGTDTIHFPELWKNAWASPGMSLDTFYIHNNVYFKRVMIPITDSINYFKKHFRFRFVNYVSLASSGQPSWQSNCDEWNIDQVYMSMGRSLADTVHKEMRFVERPPSMLKNFTSMPYPQYSNDPSNVMTDTLTVILTNRDTESHSASYSYYITQPGTSYSKTYNSSPFVMLPYFSYSSGYLMHPPVSFIYPIGTTDSTLFEMKHVLRDLNSGTSYGDTIIGYQKFYDYYSYDDGTPEAGYGLKGTGALMAYQFTLNKSPDTLRAIRIYFNHTLGHNNQQFFYLTVWSDNNGKPGDTIYHRLTSVVYTDSLNNFYTYHLENPVRISGSFYIGTEQTTDDNLNIGFDLYDNSEDFMFYNASGTWIKSTLGGSLLMRPVVGKPIPLSVEEKQGEKGRLTVFPNPCKDGVIRIRISGVPSIGDDPEGLEIIIRDLTGRQIATHRYSEIIDISQIPDGIYILTVKSKKDGQQYSGKLAVVR